uniref:Reeler domain containing 1 n=1 Tax=Calidris pygmaea TaxID=425635 RepID=A0A8C3PRH8_9CHAR
MEDGRRPHVAIAGWACTTLCLVSYTAAFSHGASLSACTDMMPRHLRAQLHSPNNNYVTVHTNMSFYFPGDKVPVTVRSTRDFMGFLLQARKVSNDEIAGTFVFIPPGSKLLTCFEDGDTVTHSDKSLKRNLSFVWKAPDQPIGDIKFFISVVQSYFVYWAKIESAIVAQRGRNKTRAGSVGFETNKPKTIDFCSSLPASSFVSVLDKVPPLLWLPPALHNAPPASWQPWFGDATAAGNLSSASRQMAERKVAPQPEVASARGEEEEEEEAAGGNTLPWVTRPAPESAVPGKGEDPGRGTRLLAAQLSILLVCTAALGLALAAALRCVCAQHCHKRTEVSFSQPDPEVIAVRDNGEVTMHFRKIRENSFVLVQAEYNWVSPSSGGKKAII